MPGSVWLDTAEIVQQLKRVIELLEMIAAYHYGGTLPPTNNTEQE